MAFIGRDKRVFPLKILLVLILSLHLFATLAYTQLRKSPAYTLPVPSFQAEGQVEITELKVEPTASGKNVFISGRVRNNFNAWAVAIVIKVTGINSRGLPVVVWEKELFPPNLQPGGSEYFALVLPKRRGILTFEVSVLWE